MNKVSETENRFDAPYFIDCLRQFKGLASLPGYKRKGEALSFAEFWMLKFMSDGCRSSIGYNLFVDNSFKDVF